jgi:hypothetical protein
MNIGGVHEVKEIFFKEGISTGRVTLFPLMSKEEKEKDQKHEDMGRNPKGRYHFKLMSNGERKIKITCHMCSMSVVV